MWKSIVHRVSDQGQGCGSKVLYCFLPCYIHTVLSKINEIRWQADTALIPLLHTHTHTHTLSVFGKKKRSFKVKFDISAQACLKVLVQ